MTDQMNTEVTSDDKLWALLAYILAPLVPIIILLMPEKKNRPFLRAHNVQALILGIITVVTSSFCIGIIVFIYAIYCGIQAYQGKLVEIPVITNLVKSQGWA